MDAWTHRMFSLKPAVQHDAPRRLDEILPCPPTDIVLLQVKPKSGPRLCKIDHIERFNLDSALLLSERAEHF